MIQPTTINNPYAYYNFLHPQKYNVVGIANDEQAIYDLFTYFEVPHWVSIDNWLQTDDDMVFYTIKNAIVMPTISEFFGMNPADPNTINVNSFMVTPKRCYNGDDLRQHICHYLNYFCKFYDPDKELASHYVRMKHMIDFGLTTLTGERHEYKKEEFILDIRRYILGSTMCAKVAKMNEDNYSLKLNYKNNTNQALQYNDTHGKIFMEISVFMNMLIPLVSHFVYKSKMTSTQEIDELFQTVYQFLFDRYINTVDLKAKLFETANTTIARDQRTNKDLWDKSEIRGMDISVNSLDAVDTLVLQVMPKYKYNQNMVMYNFTSIRNTAIQYAVGIAYEYDLVPLSSSKRDGEDSTSQFDKFEATLGKADEAKFLHNTAVAYTVMRNIESHYGPFPQDMINFYKKELGRGAKPVINSFQYKLITNFFGKLFGSVLPMKTINLDEYIELMISAKKNLIAQNFCILPEIIAGRVVKLSTRTVLSKKHEDMLTSSEHWAQIRHKYMDNQVILSRIKADFAALISSDFQLIHYDPSTGEGDQYNGQPIIINSSISYRIVEEFLLYELMV